jgi:hypothetical protein
MFRIAAGRRLVGNVVMACVSWVRRPFLFFRAALSRIRDLIAIGYYHFLASDSGGGRGKLMKLLRLGVVTAAANGRWDVVDKGGFIAPPIGVHCYGRFGLVLEGQVASVYRHHGAGHEGCSFGA